MQFLRWLFLCLLLPCGGVPLCALPGAMVPAAPDVLVVRGVSMAPLRALAEISGATFAVEGRTITVTLGAHSFACVPGSTRGWRDSKACTLQESPFLLDDCCYAPLWDAVDALGGIVTPDAAGRQATVALPGMAPFPVPLRLITGPAPQPAGTHDALYLVAADGSRVQQLSYAYAARGDTAPSMPADAPSFTPDGAALVYVHGLDIVARRVDAPGETVLTAAFSAKGIENMMPRATGDGTVYFMQRQHGEEPTLCQIGLDGDGYRCLSVGAFPLCSADGRSVAYTAREENHQPGVHLLSVASNSDRPLVPGVACAISPDGAMLCCEPLNPPTPGTVAGINSSDGAVLWQSPAPVRVPSDIHFSPDGKNLLIPAQAGLFCLSADGKKIAKLTDDEVRRPQFTADGGKIAFLRAGRLFLMNADGSAVRALAADLEVNSFTIAPNGACLVVNGHKAPALPSPADAEPARRQDTAPTPEEVAAARRAGTQTAIISTRRGNMVVELYGSDAPLTVANFVKLVKSGFYNGVTFNHVDRSVAIQCGDRGGDGSAGYTIKLEIAQHLSMVNGALAMARTNGPDSASCQFFITQGAQPQLEGLFAVFGKVVQGFEVMKKIRKGDAIVSIVMKNSGLPPGQ